MSRLGVIYGYPLRYATSIETFALVRHLNGVQLVESVPLSHPNKGVENLGRLYANLLAPLSPRFRCDLFLYANDGLLDLPLLKRMKGKPTALIWYDAYENVVEKPPPPQRLMQYLRYRNVLHADVVLGVSDVLVEMARQLQKREEAGVYMPAGVDTHLFDPARCDGRGVREQFGIPADAVVVGYLGRVGLPKGPTFAGLPLLQASELVWSDGCRDKVRYLIIAWGERLPEFKAYVERLPCREQFVFANFVPHHRVPRYLAACDVCVDTLDELFLSYARNETKMKEYLAMGKAIVATAIGENVKDLDGGGAGMLVGTSPQSIAEALITLIKDVKLRRRLGQRARQRAVERYDWRVVAGGVQAALRARGLLH